MRSAYYSRNASYSRSYNAEVAEEEGRLPRSRAAASLGLSVATFDAGCLAADVSASEWHHVGKYANEIDYYDVPALRLLPAFWAGAAAAYKTAARRAEVMARAAVYAEQAATEEAAERAAKLRSYRHRLHRRWTSPVTKPEHKSHGAGWVAFVVQAFATAGLGYAPGRSLPVVLPGDHVRLRHLIQERIHQTHIKQSMTPEWEQTIRAAFAAARVAIRLQDQVPEIMVGDHAALEARIALRLKRRGGRR